MDSSDESNALAERIREGDEGAFHDFRKRYAATFYHYFRHRGLAETDAMDLTADCLTDIPLKVRDHFDPSHTCFRAWVHLLRQRAATDWWRRRNRLSTIDLSPDLAAPVEEEDSIESPPVDAVADAIDGLDDLDRQVLELRYGGQIQPSFLEIAHELAARHGREFKEASIRQRHARALSKLKSVLHEDPRLGAVLEKLGEPRPAVRKGSRYG